MSNKGGALKECEALVKELKALRQARDTADLKMIRRAREIELRKTAIWSEFYPTFDSFLKDNHICDSVRYRNVIAADERIGQKVVDTIGAPAAAEVAKIEDSARVEKFVEAAAERYKDEGVPWSEEQAKKMRKEIAGQSPKDSLYNERVEREKHLHEENVKLRREVQRLEREIRERDEEIAKLKKLLGKGSKKAA